MNDARKITTVGWMGLGDQGAPMARAVGESDYELHVWVRRPQSLEALEGVPYILHDTVAELGAASDVVALVLREDSDIDEVLTAKGLWDSMKPGSVLVNHGTGLPGFAVKLAEQGAARGIGVLDAPVSGGNPGAVARQLATIVGGDKDVADRVGPVFETFSKKVAYMGGAGAGQIGKLINNALLMMNQKNVQDILRLARNLKLEIPSLIDLLLSGTASSFALQALLGAVTTENAEHLKVLQIIDMDLFTEAMDALGQENAELSARAVDGANGLPEAAQIVSRG